jgi:imidazolonepropionase-like amidohydrolase
VRAFAELGGDVLFGIDVGYLSDDDPTDEYVYMQRAGLTYAHILLALTTAPAARFGRARQTGRLAPGLDWDVVDGDPATDIGALARVRLTCVVARRSTKGTRRQLGCLARALPARRPGGKP